MKAYFDPSFSYKTLKNMLEAQNTSTTTLQNNFIAKEFLLTRPFVENFSMAASGHSLRKSPFQLV